jgi:hypothetical protein
VKVQGFSAKDESVLVEKNNITFATFILDTADYGYLSFNLTPTEAKLVLDRVLLDPTPSFPLETETGIHSASAFLV